jgi:hypothetical protein
VTDSGRRTRSSLLLPAVAFLTVAVLSLLGVAALLLYHNVSHSDPDTPEAVSRKFLQTAIGDRHVDQIQPYVCASWSQKESDDLSTHVPRFDDVQVNISVGDVASIGDNAMVKVDVTEAAGGGQYLEHWTLAAVKEEHWKVCGFTAVADVATPSPSVGVTPSATPPTGN